MSTTHAVATTNPEAMLKSREWTGRFIESYNHDAAPFEWTKRSVRSVPLSQSCADLRR